VGIIAMPRRKESPRRQDRSQKVTRCLSVGKSSGNCGKNHSKTTLLLNPRSGRFANLPSLFSRRHNRCFFATHRRDGPIVPAMGPDGLQDPGDGVSLCSSWLRISSKVCRNTTTIGPTKMPIGPKTDTPPITLNKANSGCSWLRPCKT